MYYDHHLGPDSKRLTFFGERKLLIIVLRAARDEQEWAYAICQPVACDLYLLHNRRRSRTDLPQSSRFVFVVPPQDIPSDDFLPSLARGNLRSSFMNTFMNVPRSARV